MLEELAEGVVVSGLVETELVINAVGLDGEASLSTRTYHVSEILQAKNKRAAGNSHSRTLSSLVMMGVRLVALGRITRSLFPPALLG